MEKIFQCLQSWSKQDLSRKCLAWKDLFKKTLGPKKVFEAFPKRFIVLDCSVTNPLSLIIITIEGVTDLAIVIHSHTSGIVRMEQGNH